MFDMIRAMSNRREKILVRAAEMFASKGIAGTTVREIADEVGIMSSSIYYHFDSKQAIGVAVVSAYMDELHRRCAKVLVRPAGSRDRFTELVAALLETVLQHRHAAEIFHNDTGQLGRVAAFQQVLQAGRLLEQIWLDLIRAGVEAGEFRADLNPVVLYQLTWATVWAAARWFTPTRDWPADRLARTYAALLLDGMTPTRPR